MLDRAIGHLDGRYPGFAVEVADLAGTARLRSHVLPRYRQSPIVAWITASAATAAVSARRMRGPSGIGVT